jgi:hypothetical protein
MHFEGLSRTDIEKLLIKMRKGDLEKKQNPVASPEKMAIQE